MTLNALFAAFRHAGVHAQCDRRVWRRKLGYIREMIGGERRQRLGIEILLVQHVEVRVEAIVAQLFDILRAKGVWAQKFALAATPIP